MKLNLDLKEILTGLLLGDLHAERPYRNGNTRLKFVQGQIHEPYALYLFGFFKGFCSTEPKIIKHKPSTQTDKIYSSIRFQTYSLPCFNEFHDLFYFNGRKIIPKNIGELLTAKGLSAWAMDDGSKHASGFRLCTDSFSLKEVNLLVKVLKINFGLNCSIHKKGKDQNRIYIKICRLNR